MKAGILQLDSLLAWPTPPRWLAPLLLLGLLIGGLLALPVPEQTPQHLRLEGEFLRLSPQDLREALQPHLASPLLQTDLQAVRETVSALPWVARVRVERRWPATLEVRVWERVVFARWNQDALIDVRGQAFSPAAGSLPEGLPELAGPVGTEAMVMARYELLDQRLRGTPLALTGLSLDPRGDWTASIANGVELRLGREAPEDRVPMMLEALLPQLSTRLSDVAYVDLRYSNGFAVGWRHPQTAHVAATSSREMP